MAAPRTILWKPESHTQAKHTILRRYLQAWIAILGMRFPKVIYVDGFAGPGRYENGDDGSPMIAIKAAIDHAVRLKGTLVFLFVEKDAARAGHLRDLVEGTALPANLSVEIRAEQSFEEAFVEFRSRHIGPDGRMPPTFAFVDPFGWTGIPFTLVRSILSQPNCEVLFNFMYEEINRFIGHPDQPANFDRLFGTGEWRAGANLAGPAERNRFLHDLYARQLREAGGARYVRSFRMRNAQGATDYYLFYATSNLLGLKRMKDAMWTVDRSGGFSFSDATDPNQTDLFDDRPNLEELRYRICRRFSQQEVAVSEIEEFVVVDTAFRSGHYKGVLKELEYANPSAIVIMPLEGRRRGTFPPALRVRFA